MAIVLFSVPGHLMADVKFLEYDLQCILCLNFFENV